MYLPTLYASLSEIDGMTGGQSKDQNNPFTGGFFVVNTEHSWQRLTSYTETGVPAVRDRIRHGSNQQVCPGFIHAVCSSGFRPGDGSHAAGSR